MSSWGRPSQPEKEGRASRGKRDVVGTLKIKSLWKSWCTSCWLCWRQWWWHRWWMCFWRQLWLTLQSANSLKHVTKESTGTAANTICLVTVADFCVYKHSICIFGFNISHLFLLHSYPPQIIDISRAICEHVSNWLSTSWICVRISFVFPRFFYTIFFPRILCCKKVKLCFDMMIFDNLALNCIVW